MVNAVTAVCDDSVMANLAVTHCFALTASYVRFYIELFSFWSLKLEFRPFETKVSSAWN